MDGAGWKDQRLHREGVKVRSLELWILIHHTHKGTTACREKDILLCALASVVFLINANRCAPSGLRWAASPPQLLASVSRGFKSDGRWLQVL